MTGASASTQQKRRLCSAPQEREFPLPASIDPRRARAIINYRSKWVNQTTLHYAFFEDVPEWAPSNERQVEAVEQAFAAWKEVGIGLEFQRVADPSEAEIRIGFEQGDGAWSYIGREVLMRGVNERTMNLGWDVAADPDTALHEIGHTLGFPHEHQNPFAGLEWDEEAVYEELGGSPNFWDRATTYHNIIRKLSQGDVRGSKWDADSIMHYPFEPGLIRRPEQYRLRGLYPKGGLSPVDVEYVRSFYPPVAQAPETEPVLRPLEAVKLDIAAGEQRNFRIVPTDTRTYEIQTFGPSDATLVLFEKDGKETRYLTADDDSGSEANAKLRVKLMKGREYVLRARLVHVHTKGQFGLMLW